MGTVLHLHDPFDPTKRRVHRLSRSVTVRRLVSRRKELRAHTVLRTIGRRKVREFRRPTVCLLNGKPLLRRHWKRTVIGASDVVTFYAAPLGGGGGGKNPLGVILALAVAVAVPYLGPMLGGVIAGAMGLAATTTLTTAIGGAIVGLTLGLVSYGIMSLFAPPPPASANWQSGYGGTPQSSPTYSNAYTLGAAGNTARLGQPVPELFGRHRVFPDFVAAPYVRYVADEQFLHFTLGLSVGSVEIEEERIGDTPISSFDEIVTEQVEPGDVGDPEIADPRWLVCRDIAESELADAAAGSPYAGPFITNVAGTEVAVLEVDFVAARGLYKYTNTGALDTKSIDITVEGRLVDDDDAPVGDGSWDTLESFTLSGAQQSARRVTRTYDGLTPGRWEVRVKRTDTKDTATSAAHTVSWTGLRGQLTTERRFADITVVNVRMKATGDLNGQSSRQYNAIATRKLPTWDAEEEEMGTALAATRSPCDAFAYIGRASNAARLADSQIDLAGLYASKEEFAEAGWTFDFVFDQTVTLSEALGRVARAVLAERVVQGSKLCLVRDVASAAPVMMFSPRNIKRGSVEIEYKTVDSESSDSLALTTMDPRSWRPAEKIFAFDDSPQERTTALQAHGVTGNAQRDAIGWWRLRENKYRRRTVRWRTEMEGLCVQYGDPIRFSHDVPRWGQTAEILAFDEDERIATLSEPLDWTTGAEGATHYVALRHADGTMAGPFEAAEVEGEPNQVEIGEGDLPEILTGGDRERTFIQFGPGEEYARKLKAIGITPKGDAEAEILAIDDDPRMYADLPEDDEPDVGAPTEDLEVHISSNTNNVNLRSVANAGGFTGNPVQAVTIIIDEGVSIGSTSSAVAAVMRGSWPGGLKPTLINLGTISGAHGASPGAAGGTALDCQSGPITVDNTGALMRGGGGAGGAGGAGGTGGSTYFEFPVGEFFGGATALGGGSGSPGETLSFGGYTGTGGAGGAPGANGTSGGYGESGTSGATGATGGTGSTDSPFNPIVSGGSPGSPGGAGGAAGYAVQGNANITWVGTGTRIGPVA